MSRLYEVASRSIARALRDDATTAVLPNSDGSFAIVHEQAADVDHASLCRRSLDLAGVRIDTIANAPLGLRPSRRIALLQLSTGACRDIALPRNAELIAVRWARDSSRAACAVREADGVYVYVLQPEVAECSRVGDVRLNTLLGCILNWNGDGSLLCSIVPPKRAAGVSRRARAMGPRVRMPELRQMTMRPFAGLLQDDVDEMLFEDYFKGQLCVLSLRGRAEHIGEPDFYTAAFASDSSGRVLATTLVRPFSRNLPVQFFRATVRVLSADNPPLEVDGRGIARDRTPGRTYATGLKAHLSWAPGPGSHLVWVESSGRSAPLARSAGTVWHWDTDASPAPMPLFERALNVWGVSWCSEDKMLLAEGSDDDTYACLWLIERPFADARFTLLLEGSANDPLTDPGAPIVVTAPCGAAWARTIRDGSELVLVGERGVLSFVSSIGLADARIVALWQASAEGGEWPLTITASGRELLVLRTHKARPPEYVLQSLTSKKELSILQTRDHVPSFAHTVDESFSIQASDGPTCGIRVRLPLGFVRGRGVPVLLWIYPLLNEERAEDASRLDGATAVFRRPHGFDAEYLALAGCAVVSIYPQLSVTSRRDGPSSLKREVVNSVEAVLKLIEARYGLARASVTVGGHSFGAFAAALILAEMQTLAGGILCSGCYNRTLTPFGFQYEARTLWQAPQVYIELSPLFVADRIRAPTLLIHGADDANPGTPVKQSESMYAALVAAGVEARLVILPHEGHTFQSVRSVGHILHECVQWMTDHLPRSSAEARV